MSWSVPFGATRQEARAYVWNGVGLTVTIISFNACVALTNAIESVDVERLRLKMAVCVALCGVALSLILNAFAAFNSNVDTQQKPITSITADSVVRRASSAAKKYNAQRRQPWGGDNPRLPQKGAAEPEVQQPLQNVSADTLQAHELEQSRTDALASSRVPLCHLPPKATAVVSEDSVQGIASLPSSSMVSRLLPTPIEPIQGVKTYWLDAPRYAWAACRYLLEESGVSTVSVDCEGVKLSKQGSLCIVAVATSSDYVFLFDICSLGASAFNAGLRELLESPKFMKVFQDARQDADALYWQFGVNVRSILDTQIADAIIRYKQWHNASFVLSLPKLLSKYCPEHTIAARVGDIKKATNEQVNSCPELWRERPLSPALIEYAAIDVCVLLPLWAEMKVALKTAMKCLEDTHVEATVMSLSEVYAESFKQLPYACYGPAFARIPQELLAAFPTEQSIDPPFFEIDWDSGVFSLDEGDVHEQVCKVALKEPTQPYDDNFTLAPT